MGNGCPVRPLVVSPQHRLLVCSPIARRMFGGAEVLVAARQLVGLPGIEVARDIDAVDYVHVMCARHEVIFADGTPVETLFPGKEARKVLPRAALREAALILQVPARPLATGRRARQLAERYLKHAMPLQASH